MALAVRGSKTNRNDAQREAVEHFLSLPESKQQRLVELVRLFQTSDDEDEKEEIREVIAETLFRRAEQVSAEALDAGVTGAGAARLRKHREYVAGEIRRRRHQLGLTQRELAEASGLPQSHISRIEKGLHAPTHVTISKLAQSLNVAPAALDPGFDD